MAREGGFLAAAFASASTWEHCLRGATELLGPLVTHLFGDFRIAVAPGLVAAGETSVSVDEGMIVCAVGPGAPSGSAFRRAIERWGWDPNMWSRGEFGVVAWDRARKRLSLTCDRIGRFSPAYWGDDREFFVSSRAIAVATHPKLNLMLNDDYAAHVVDDSWAQVTASTAFRKVKRAQPGGVVHREKEGAISASDPAPLFSRATPMASDCRGSNDAFWRALTDAVSTVAVDHKVALSLSDGVDSMCIAAALGRARVPFTALTFVDDRVTRARLKRWARSIGAIDFSVVEPERLRSRGADASDLADDPCTIGPGLNGGRRALYEAASKRGCTLVLDGEGGDEIFAIAPHIGARVADRLVRIAPLFARRNWIARKSSSLGACFPPWLATRFRSSDAIDQGTASRARWLGLTRFDDRLNVLLAAPAQSGSAKHLFLDGATRNVTLASPYFSPIFIDRLGSIRAVDLLAPDKRFLRRALAQLVSTDVANDLIGARKSQSDYERSLRSSLACDEVRVRFDEIEGDEWLRGAIDLAALDAEWSILKSGAKVSVRRLDQFANLLELVEWRISVRKFRDVVNNASQ